MAEDKERDAEISRQNERVAQEMEQHKDQDVDLIDMEDVSGGWKISYETDPGPLPTSPVDTFGQ